jgi:adenosylcobinamide-GDP ribazoletransferase
VVRGRQGREPVRDAWRLAFGTLTVLRVRRPSTVDRRTAGRAMVLAPLVGLVLGGGVAVLLGLLSSRLDPLLAAALAVALLALLTRGLHLDGLADTADGLGSGKPAEQALSLMSRGDVGPFGVLTVVLVLLVQVAALQALFADGRGPAAVAVAGVVSRAVLPLLCSVGVPAARRGGLGAQVAGTVSRRGLLAAASVSVLSVLAVLGVGLALRAAVGLAPTLAPGRTLPTSLGTLVALTVPVLAAGLLAHRCVRRLGGVSGDVLGAAVEVAFTACVVLLALTVPGR